jgi:diguanylate cyclase (GGDEF)-like protein
VELLLAVLVVSVVVNLTLLAWVSRADDVKLHWPRPLVAAYESLRPRAPSNDMPTVRRRTLYVAERPTLRAPVPPVNGSTMTRSSLTETLPPDLAEFLSRPATVAPQGDGSGFVSSGDGAGRHSRVPIEFGSDGRQIMARLPQSSSGAGSLGADPLTGLEGPNGWSRIVEIENARLLRYRRPATVVMAEVEGLGRLADRLGDEPVERLLPVIADAFRHEARSSDWIARIGMSRFAAFLPETDEIQAINYVERVRIVCEPWLASAAVPLRLAIGWSSPAASTDLEYAILRAEERMHADRRMPGKSLQPPRVVPARVMSLPPSGPEVETELEPATAQVGASEAADAAPPAQTPRPRGRRRGKSPAGGASAES